VTIKEDVLSRMHVLLGGVDGIKTVLRDVDEFPDVARPTVILLAGDTEAVPEFQRSWVKGEVPIMVDMRPVVLLLVSGDQATVGADTDELEGRIIKAIMSDATLPTLISRPGGVYYDRSDYRLSHDLAMACDVQIQFRVRTAIYPNHP